MGLRYSVPVTSRQTLPLLWLLSDARTDAGLEDALAALPRGSGFVFRHYHLDDAERRARFDRLAEVARAHSHTVILSRAAGWGEDGRYGTKPSPDSRLFLATAHNGDEIRRAINAGAHGIFLSPVFSTASHPESGTLGIHGFHVLAQQSSVPVIALGGMTHERAQVLDWPRWGAIDGLVSTKSA